MSMRPAIGLCATEDRARYGSWDEEVNLLPRSYLRSVQRAGGLALLLPPDPELADDPAELLDRLHGLVLTGGSDIDPGSYGAEPHEHTAAVAPGRDRFEIALARGALARDMPVLGICRGMQVLNVALGGGIEQHLPDIVGHEGHRHTPGTFSDHRVRLEPGSLAARVVGREEEHVKSHHHQALDGLGEGLVPTGWSIADGVVEAIELPERRFALGVLWHPEEDEASRVLATLVDEARELAGDRAAAR